MKLPSYLKSKKLTQAAFARLIGESPQNIQRYVSGKRIPSDEEIMRRIFEATGGAVTANDFYNLPNRPNKT